MREFISVLFFLIVPTLSLASSGSWDLGKVENLDSFRLSTAVQAKLAKTGFVVIPSREEEIFQIYKDAKRRGEPILVTSDLLLHTSHILFDYLLRIVEVERLTDELRGLTEAMYKGSLSQYEQARGGKIKEAARGNISFFGVAARLLGLQVELPAAILPKWREN